jgi:glyoxylase I family protein
LERRGVAVQEIRVDEYTNRRFVFFADPDGLPLELYESDDMSDDMSAEESDSAGA